ncbi:hypothetical protein [Bifidobacterium mongoliense]|jgi:hypothetical protein|uniref:Dioxygenase-like 2-nitropropane dioxygenase n=1 Tax=Bifidobacterium mongoliense TaxID=518643 RepID=A0A423UEC9_9BIFI|nr:hypothetical protein [Bifidobacterium mongoliense]MDN5633463.1 hydrolase [Bifidobacterium mongoliense]MDN6769190.1 hydrolase [Bifidobacterium mongoliense]MDN6783271.1 hydrolase [Bifidobacterium mongoliense]MDN6802319.1 hydrolase [Bifidobacterium mongoliense]MDY3125276.1 hydrolase [Bifidobacterium mongoliense]
MTMQGLPEGYRDEGTYLEPQDQDRAEFVVEGSRAPREALPIENPLSSPAARVPKVIARSSGIVLQGRRLHSFIYSTDVAIIRNTNADAVLAVYPFTGHPVITQAILAVAQAPVFVGVGGGTTTGSRVIELAVFAEMQGVAGVVLNSPSPVTAVRDVAMAVNIPVVATVTQWDRTVADKIEAGAGAINVAAGRDTPRVVYSIRERYPEIPVLASSGRDDVSILETIAAGANALTWTPPSAQVMQGAMMNRYRGQADGTPDDHGAQAGSFAKTGPKHKRQSAGPGDSVQRNPAPGSDGERDAGDDATPDDGHGTADGGEALIIR